MLALIAGQGALPATLVAAVSERPLICALEGTLPQGLDPDVVFRLESLGSLLTDLGNRGVTRVCFCGGIDRPSVDHARLDAATLPLVPIFMEALQQGDDGALRAAIGIFQSAGFDVMAAHEIAPHLLLQDGIVTAAQPYAKADQDARLGDATLADMGLADLGQACVIRDGRIIAREDTSGTDAMLQGLKASDAKLGMLYKGPKPDQDRRVDLPTIGPMTVEGAARAGLAGVTIEAGGVIVLDRPAVVSALNRHGMFLWARTRGT